MRTLRFLLLSLFAGLSAVGAQAQVGYQIALLNTATGEARANETVTVSVSLSNNAGEAFYSETKQATTNDFGILSLSIGNADTFANVDLTKMPFFIEVTANGTLIGKSQILSVPVAEVAKRVAPMDKNLIVGTWKYQSDSNKNDSYRLHFYENGRGAYQYLYSQKEYRSAEFEYQIEGNNVYLYNSEGSMLQSNCRYHNGHIYFNGEQFSK